MMPEATTVLGCFRGWIHTRAPTIVFRLYNAKNCTYRGVCNNHKHCYCICGCKPPTYDQRRAGRSEEGSCPLSRGQFWEPGVHGVMVRSRFWCLLTGFLGFQCLPEDLSKAKVASLGEIGLKENLEVIFSFTKGSHIINKGSLLSIGRSHPWLLWQFHILQWAWGFHLEINL